jgi:hypothetical protein
MAHSGVLLPAAHAGLSRANSQFASELHPATGSLPTARLSRGRDNALAGDKANGGIMAKFKKKNDSAKGASGLTVTDLLAPKFAAYDPENNTVATPICFT